ncbi:formylglycine-generating enzyme family protein [Candidatus Uabimicrobium amorphum]|uniref:Sulfatase-modifying factor enzyme-like domain-containing protein n=1 Tax=Uabimicrobium amorphum TaxID=2596890 RepID=A0A5S9ITV9_UABAM|nr:formylglycine-generating enzyme family protein [Candidatus Uabimicrobium amorphum]BBM87677.1 hypothetical protein UABAM_06089 [Candidatus Uabimicrobium amorphum]
MDRKVVKGKSLQKVEPNTKYMGCSFYLDYVDGEDLEGTEFDNCSFRGEFRDWGRDEYGLWMAITYKNVRQVMRWIKPGTFIMGSPQTEEGREGDEVQHQVTLSQGFWLAETACTQELWKVVMSENPSYFKGNQRPVERVNWDDCQVFLDKWNKEITGGELSLLTEAQWEYACRAGTTTAFSFGETVIPEQEVSYVVYETVEVKSLPCNSWGLYEMHGNVLEWCSDWYGEYSDSKTTDPVGAVSGTYRVLRGGCWFYSSSYVRSASRDHLEPDDRDDYRCDSIGFRFCLRSQK